VVKFEALMVGKGEGRGGERDDLRASKRAERLGINAERRSTK